MNIKQLFCRHTYLGVVRMHKDTVPRRERAKVLYVDDHNVWNFIRCVDCGKTFYGEQKEKLFSSLEF